MRDGEGVYLGHHMCRRWQGVDRYAEVECCGGRLIRTVFIKCFKKGVVNSGGCARCACDAVEERGREEPVPVV